MLTDVVSPEVFERDVAVPATKQVEVLPVQDAGVLASRTGDPVTKRTSIEGNVLLTDNNSLSLEMEFSMPGIRRESRDGGPHPAASASEDAVIVWDLVRAVPVFKTWRRT